MNEPTHSTPAVVSPVAPAWAAPVQTVLSLLVTAGLFFLIGRWSLPSAEPPSPHVEIAVPALNLNRATRAELRLLPGVGDVLAQRIVSHRARYGPFRDVDDLRRVPGIGARMLERMRPWLFIGTIDRTESAETLSTAAERPAVSSSAKRSGKAAALTGPIDVNRAEAAELRKLPGIGPKLSQRIIDERTLRGPFKSADDLRRVSGIGPKTLERLRPHVIAVPPPVVAARP